jgi:hypothetical protein
MRETERRPGGERERRQEREERGRREGERKERRREEGEKALGVESTKKRDHLWDDVTNSY